MIFLKQFLISLVLISLILFVNKDNIVIPEDAIRIRIIPNSNSKVDQDIKIKVKENVEEELYSVLKDVRKVEEAREIIEDNMDNIDNLVYDTLNSNSYTLPYDIKFGYNYFPQKEYMGVKYDEGMYESLVITLGEGKGDNWWCIMFPPFCLLEANQNYQSEIEYKSIIKEMINNYFK